MNDLPELVKDHDHCGEDVHKDTEELFSGDCEVCGNISLYADDVVYTTSSKHRENNQDRLRTVLNRIQTYLNNNYMTINLTKTILWELMMKQKECKIKGSPPTLLTRDGKGNFKEVTKSRSEKCLGAYLAQDLQWKVQIDTGAEALVPTLRKKLGCLKHLAGNIPDNGRKLLVNGLILGKINYLLPLYGGTQNKYLDKIQVIMNNAARFALRAGKRAKSEDLMRQMNWLNVRELVKYHTIIMAWKLVYCKTLRHLYDKVTIHDDRSLSTNMPRLQNTELGLRWRLVSEWNSLLPEIQNIQSLPRFKSRTKNWIKSLRAQQNMDPNVPQGPPNPVPQGPQVPQRPSEQELRLQGSTEATEADLTLPQQPMGPLGPPGPPVPPVLLDTHQGPPGTPGTPKTHADRQRS